jgi:hypothetical protein
MRALVKLSRLVRTPTMDSIKPLLRNLVSRLMITLLRLSRLLVAYILVVLLLILTMNMLNSCLMIYSSL